MQALALKTDWLTNSGCDVAMNTTVQAGGPTSGGVTSPSLPVYDQHYYGYNYWPWTYIVPSSPARPIKLSLSEIERLRKAARADEKLKAILAKFTDQIEIAVDFE